MMNLKINLMILETLMIKLLKEKTHLIKSVKNKNPLCYKKRILNLILETNLLMILKTRKVKVNLHLKFQMNLWIMTK